MPKLDNDFREYFERKEEGEKVLAKCKQGLREGGSGGTLYPRPGLGGPGLRGPGRVEVVASSFGPTGPHLMKTFFFGLHLIFGKNQDQI